MQRHLDQEIATLKDKLLTMASNAETLVINAVKALVDHSDDLARSVQEKDNIVDELEVEIDEMAIHLLSKAPLASDLRFIVVASKIAQNLERVADEATTVARRTLELNQEPQLKPYIDIPRMAQLALDMLKVALDAFVNRESEKARAVIPRDKEVDGIHKQLQRELASFMVENPKNIGRCLNLMVVSKALERIADHATNIAEEVVYLCEAEDIRHGGKKQ
ncbi:MAG: phosphate uptake regulator, PhoU [Verrucomicrobiales bacterium]|nr:phosphate uptake regulator, PhoU [Verrucomicrobiales bacterium]